MSGWRESLLNYSVLGLGTGTGYTAGSKLGRDDFCRIFDAAKDSGVNWIDSAEAYSDGYAETIIGDYLKSRPSGFFVASKFSPVNAHPEALKRACERSLLRLNKDCIDLYQFHWMNYSVPLEDTVGALMDLQSAGKISEVGVCNFSISEVELCESLGLKVSSNQVEFNLFNRALERGFFEVMERMGVRVIGYSPFDGIATLPPDSERSQVLNQISHKYEASVHNVALSYLTGLGNLHIVYSSTNVSHILRNSEALELSKDDAETLDTIFSSTLELVDPGLVKIRTDESLRFYNNLDDAIENRYGYFPGVVELAEEFKLSENFKPIRVTDLQNDSCYKYELKGGMMRYWGWILANGFSAPIPSIRIGR